MKKILQWLKGPKSDFILFIIFLVLLNIAGHRAFVRFDLRINCSEQMETV